MKNVATSMVLACANLILVGLGYLDNWKHIFPERLPAAISLGVIGFVVIPFLFLATVGFAIRDLFRPGSRWQAMIAFVLSVPIGIVYSRPW